MRKIIFRRHAINDLTEIWEYTVLEWSEAQADKYYKAIKSACTEISKNPDIGFTYENIRKNLRGFKTGKHIIFYHTVSEDEVEIIRILHEMMDLKSKMKR